ncbi:MAG: hypothetical protein LQ349_000096 [Xanthoria aureola]|nr:MAG: hypothetical protein LQ349_000096 [Xanthoria aureola]
MPGTDQPGDPTTPPPAHHISNRGHSILDPAHERLAASPSPCPAAAVPGPPLKTQRNPLTTPDSPLDRFNPSNPYQSHEQYAIPTPPTSLKKRKRGSSDIACDLMDTDATAKPEIMLEGLGVLFDLAEARSLFSSDIRESPQVACGKLDAKRQALEEEATEILAQMDLCDKRSRKIRDTRVRLERQQVENRKRLDCLIANRAILSLENSDDDKIEGRHEIVEEYIRLREKIANKDRERSDKIFFLLRDADKVLEGRYVDAVNTGNESL